MFPRWEENKPFTVALLVLVAYGVMFLWAKTDLTLRQAAEVGKPVPYEHTIYLDGLGRATGKPDLATVTVTVESRDVDLAAAQEKNNTAMNLNITNIKGLDIPSDDIQTANYSSWQDCAWNEEQGYCVPTDWVVSQSITVKVRDTEKVSDVLQIAGQNGATVSGPNFTIDDTSALRAEARKDAMKDVMEKANVIADELGLRIESIVGYSEYANDPYAPQPYPYYDSAMLSSKGGADIQAGTQEVSMTVNVTFKLVD